MCPRCGNSMYKNGTRRQGHIRIQKYHCNSCGHYREEKKDKESFAFKPLQMGITTEQLRAKHDANYIIMQATKKLEKDVFLTESEFIKISGIRMGSGYRQALDNPDLGKYKGRVQGVIYYSHPDSINKMKEEGILT